MREALVLLCGGAAGAEVEGPVLVLVLHRRHVSTALQQQLRHRRAVVLCGGADGGVPLVGLGVHVGPLVQQQPTRVDGVGVSAEVECGEARVVGMLHVSALVQEQRHNCGVVMSCCPLQRRISSPIGVVNRSSLVEQQPHRLNLPHVRRQVQRCVSSIVLLVRVWVVFRIIIVELRKAPVAENSRNPVENSLEHFHVTVACSVMQRSVPIGKMSLIGIILICLLGLCAH
mmetsp:Transcript_49044/g.98311  ORF Transcript_49044/g.98311 Transcript_49044/m.98311 type:complete len:229 (-) Transcript_49044:53-739(-)